ncbi:EF-hand calcium-binding domain-containing protein 5-like [Babylonia areolata]|uniref:EF-hand calcium-binding domain-containing protein 5-like n=1 Tax=Babylonia areolata TaxID=304850 RepID=UPI003FD55DF0
MADTAFAQPPGSAGSGFMSPTKISRGGSRGETPGSSGRSSIVKNDVKRWKRMHEQNAMLRLTELRSAKKVEVKTSKEIARKIARKIPIELLAKEWLKDCEATIEMRAYMVDKVLPTLILGVEKLLNTVDERGLANPEAGGGYDPNFNPLNFLAQYLFRNNPRYSNFSEASPYVHGLRQIAEDLKAQLFDMEDNRLARIKAEAKRKREEREKQARLRQQEKERRQEALMTQFAEWNVPTDNNRVELSLLQNALRSFMEVAEQFPPEIQEVAKFGHPLESTDETGRTLAVTEFAQYLSLYVETLPPEVFEQFMVHMSKCANAHRASAERENRRIMLTNLFIYCDHSGIGLLDRHRILNLFEQFWDVYEDSKKKLRNPRRWPVVEVDEVDDSLIDDDDDESVPTIPETAREDEEAQKLQEQTGSKQESAESLAQEPTEEKAETGAEGADAETSKGQEEEGGEEEGEKPQEPAAQEEKAEAGETSGAGEEKDRAAEERIQIEDGEEPAGKDEAAQEEKEAEEGEQKEQKDKEEVSADPELGQDVDITGEMAKSGLQPRAPQPTPAATGRASITFAQGTAFEREKTGLTATSMRSQSQMSAFDESNLNVSQFVQLTETFLGEQPDGAVFGKLASFIREGYEETEDEKMERLMKARKEAISANRKGQLDTLFEKWDNDGSGYLDLDEVEEVMAKYKEGQEKDTVSKAREDLKKQSKYQDSRLNKKEFRTFIGLVIDALPGADAFEYFVEFLANSVERSYAERVRGEARKKWLQSIMTAAETSGISLDPVYKSVFQALYRDAEAHGGEKKISASVSLLEKNVKFPERGDVLLRYTACTPEDAEFVLNKALYKDMKGISFSAVEQGKPIHVPRVNTHGNIYFWNTDRAPEDREGSFIVVPLKDRKRRVFGVLGIDTLADPHSKAIFITHEIQYFQGVAQTFSDAYHLVDMRRKLLRITESAISWMKRRSPNVREIMVYMVEPGKGDDFVLRRMMTTDNKGFPVHMKDPPVRLERKDNLFRDYLFKSVDNSETVTADAYGNRQLAFPLRNDKGKAMAVVDISTGTLKNLPAHENKEIQRMLRLLQQAHKEITREFAGEDKLQVLDAEKNDDTRMDIMFDRLMLMELRDNVSKLDSKAYAELKAYNSPPQIVLDILQATLAIFYRDLAEEGEFDDWNKIKTYINSDLSQKIQAYDPTASLDLISPGVIENYLKDVPHGEVAKHGSLPAQHLYNWVFVVLSLIEHTRKMREDMEAESLGQNSEENEKK